MIICQTDPGGSRPGLCVPWPKTTPSFAPVLTGHVIDVVTREPASRTSLPDMARFASSATHRSDVLRLVTRSAPQRGHSRRVAQDRKAPPKAGPSGYVQGPEPPTASTPHTSPCVPGLGGIRELMADQSPPATRYEVGRGLTRRW